jgi:hypothetical protein
MKEPEIKILSLQEMRLRRLESSRLARDMTMEQVQKQMRQNGAIMTPNPWYRPRIPEKEPFRLSNEP